ncbi:ureidoglycolate lyase [Salipiger sp. H15]|uniref:Ureidoglycolate lyase n=1 Tax=Alloyangia sp. H15 TaxID=3029062 RepID=A0AAU8AML2_9RHOB
MRVPIRPFEPARFAAFGASFELPSEPGQRLGFCAELSNGRGTAALARLDAVLVAPVSLPIALPRMERHPFSSQSFLPLDGAAYIVAVAREGADGGPDPATLEAWQVPGSVAVTYHAGTWHAPLAVPGRAGRFAVFMYTAGQDGHAGPGDEDWAELPPGISLVPK